MNEAPRGMRQIVLLRGINLGPRNRISMPELRQQLTEVGFTDVATYLQSGNIVLSSACASDELAERVRGLISKHFGLDIAVVVRSRDELAEVVRRNPLGEVADNPKRYQVSFLARELAPGRADELAAAAVGGERLVAQAREIYAWHPDGVARSKLWGLLAGPELGVTATARNWTTVLKLLEMAGS